MRPPLYDSVPLYTDGAELGWVGYGMFDEWPSACFTIWVFKGGDAVTQVFQGSRWRHKKRGTVHIVLNHAKLQTDKPLEDNAVLIVYRSEDGTLWARPDEEFADGRFELMRES